MSATKFEGFEYRVELARRLLAVGRSLKQAARAAEMTSRELDLALWRRVGTPKL